MREVKYPVGWGWSPDHPWRARPGELGPMPGRRTSEPLARLVAGLAVALRHESQLVFELLLGAAPPVTTAALFTAGWIQAIGGADEDLRLDQLACLWELIDDCQQISWRAMREEISTQEAYEALGEGRKVLAIQREEFAWLEDASLLAAAAEVDLT